MSVATAIAIVSVAIALASFAVNYRLADRAAVRARKPVLIFLDDPAQNTWLLRNVGNGPALNVLVAQRHEGVWFNPVILPPLSAESSYALLWLGRINITGLGATYTDFEDRPYTSTLGGERSRTYDGNHLPEWEDMAIRRHWQLRVGEGIEMRWAPRASSFKA